MKTRIFFSLSMAVFFSLSCKSLNKQKDLGADSGEEALSIRYHSWKDDITIAHSLFSHVETQYHYPPDRPYVATPDSMSTLIRKEGVSIPSEKLEELRQLILESGFMDLEDNYGAPEEQRFYPYKITVSIGDQTKEVMYRSNPEYEGAPEAFQKLEEFLFSLSDSLR